MGDVVNLNRTVETVVNCQWCDKDFTKAVSVVKYDASYIQMLCDDCYDTAKQMLELGKEITQQWAKDGTGEKVYIAVTKPKNSPSTGELPDAS